LGHSKRNGGGKKRRGHNLKRDKTMWGGGCLGNGEAKKQKRRVEL